MFSFNWIDIVDFTMDGKCSNCGNCCSRHLPISSKEKKEIIRFCTKHDMSLPIFKIPFDMNNVLFELCPFHDIEKKRCLIYQVRPQICRQFMCNDSKKALYIRNLFTQRYGLTDMLDIVELCMDKTEE